MPEWKGQSQNDAEDGRIEDGMASGPYSFDGFGTSSRREVDNLASEISGPQWDRAERRERWSFELEVRWRSRRPGLVMAGRKVDPDPEGEGHHRTSRRKGRRHPVVRVSTLQQFPP